MKLKVTFAPVVTVDVSPREILSCSTRDDLMTMIRAKLRQAVVPKNFNVDTDNLVDIVQFWMENFVEHPIKEDVPLWSHNDYMRRDDNYNEDYRGFKHN